MGYRYAEDVLFEIHRSGRADKLVIINLGVGGRLRCWVEPKTRWLHHRCRFPMLDHGGVALVVISERYMD